MSRIAVVTDRILVFVIGALLLAAGIALTLWSSDNLTAIDSPLKAAWLADLSDESWWRWASGGVGVVFVLIGLRWLLVHVQRGVQKTFRLRGSSERGRLNFEVDALLDAAADRLETTLGIRSAHGRLVKERGQMIAVIDAKAEPAARLADLSKAGDRVLEELATALGREDIHSRVHYTVARRGKAISDVN